MSLDLVPEITTSRALVLREVAGQDRVLTPQALSFLTELQVRFGNKLNALMVARERRQERFDQGIMPDYLEDTKDIRKGIWSAATPPAALLDRRTETRGAATRERMVTALSSGARVFTADLEDGAGPAFSAIIAAHANLLDHRDGPLDQVGSDPAILALRPRALHQTEANVLIGGYAMSAALFDFGLDVFHNGRALAATGRGPFYALAKLESHREARFWAEVFQFAEDRMGLAKGAIRATIALECLQAAYEMDEIVWELRDHAAAMSLNRANYTTSYIRAMRAHSDRVLPADLPEDRAFLATVAARLVKVCHRRGILAIGDDAAGYEVRAGFDGTCAADIAAARAVFDDEMPGQNQLRIPRQGWRIEPEMLVQPHQGAIPSEALDDCLTLAITQLAQWLCGQPADLAGAERARMQVWQWRRHGAEVGGTRLTSDRLAEAMQDRILALLGEHGADRFHRARYASAARIVQEAVGADIPPDHLSTAAYPVLNAID